MAIVRAAPGPAAARRDETAPRRGTERTIVEPRGGGVSEAIGRRWGRGPIAAWGATTLLGWALLAAAIAVLAVLVTDVLLKSGAVADADGWLPGWLADHRTAGRTDLSKVGSMIGDVPVIPALVTLTAIVSLVLRRARIGVFLITAIVMELSLYRLGALAGPRERPEVPRLDHLPSNESFPSGHVAAATVVYFGLAMLISSGFRRRAVTVVVWTVAVALVLIVASSRMYRGMHHPIDALAGLLLGLGCLAASLVAIRVYGVVRERRDGRRRVEEDVPEPAGHASM